VILHSVQIENFKGLRGPLNLAFDESEVNLVLGPNGAGKSTLREAIETVLVENHNTSGAVAEQMRPWDTAMAPSITLTFSEGGEVYRLSKTFLDSPRASLERRSGSQFDMIAKGKAVDEQVRAMLRSQAVKAKDKAGERLGLLSVLFGGQDVHALPALSGDALADIRQMLGAQLSGQRGAALEHAARKKLLGAWTREDEKAKVKKGRLAELEDLLGGAREALTASQAILARVSDLESSARAARGRHRDMSASLATLLPEHKALAAVAQQVIDLRTKSTVAQSSLEAAKAQYGLLSREIEAIVDAGTKKSRCKQAHSRLVEAEAACLRERDARAERARLAREGWEQTTVPDREITRLEQRIETAATYLHKLEERNVLGNRLRRAESAARRKSKLETALAQLNAPDAATWAEIQRTTQEADEARIRVEALALRLEIQAETDLSGDVLDGEPSGSVRLELGETFVARGDGRLKLRLPGVGTFDLSGPTTDAADWRRKQQESEGRLHHLIAPFGLAGWRDLAARVERRNALSGEFMAADAELAAALGSETMEALRNREHDLAASQNQALTAEPSWAMHSPDMQALREEAGARKADCERFQANARAVWAAADRERMEAADAAATATANRVANQADMEGAEQTLAQLQADGKTLAERREGLDGKRRACDRAEDDLRGIDLTLAELPPDAPERAIVLAQQIETAKSELQGIRESYQQGEAGMRAILLQGPYSNVAAAEERVRQMEQEYAGELLRVNAIKRLWDAIQKAKGKALEGLAEPVQQRATGILERIAGRPIATVELGTNMAPASVQPNRCTAQAALDQMSVGEQEQIYFATQLALAEVVSQNERQVLLLDDPLVNTDGERLARILDLIDQHSRRLQVVILSCHPERYGPLHGATRQEIAGGEILTVESLMGAAV
jgi:DNA repair exonuclease SbcCD ATPase subunit